MLNPFNASLAIDKLTAPFQTGPAMSSTGPINQSGSGGTINFSPKSANFLPYVLIGLVGLYILKRKK